MPTVEKIIEKMKTAPNSITERELLRVLYHRGFKQSHRNGSHATFKNPVTKEYLIIPIHKIIKACYIENVLQKIGEKDEN